MAGQNPVRLALAGAGSIGKRHLAALAHCPGVELVGIADPFPAASEVADAHGVPIFTSVDELMVKVRPEGVIVATPTEHHYEPTIAALKAGAHVLVEKPVMATMEEANAVTERAQQTGKHVLVGHQRRYYGLAEKAREIIHNGTLGQLVTICGQWNVRKNESYYDPDWRRKWQAGPVLTNLIHEIDLLRYICGDLISISAETSNIVQGFEKEDATALIMRFENGALGTFILSDQANSPWTWEQATGENAAFPKTGQNAIRFMGTRASLDFPNLVLWHNNKNTPDWNHAFQREDITMPIEDAYVLQINHFADVVAGRAKPRIDAADAAKSLQATLAVYKAARTGCRVNLT